MPPSRDYVPGPEHPLSSDYVPGLEYPPSPDYVPEPEYSEYLVPSNDEVLIEDQPLPADASPTALSPGYVAKFNPEDDLEEDPEDEPEKDPVEYPIDGGDEEEDESSRDDANDEDEEEASKEENDDKEEEHLALTDSTTLPAIDPVSSVEDTEAFKTNESAPTPPSPKLYIPSPPLLLPSTTHGDDILEENMPFRKRAHFTAPTDATPRPPMSRVVGYGIMDVWDDMVGEMEGRALTTLEELSQRVTDPATTLAQDTHEIHIYKRTPRWLWWWRGFGGGDGGVIRRVKESDGGIGRSVTRAFLVFRRKSPLESFPACMSTRSSSSNLFPSSSDPESIIRNRRRNLGDPSLLLDFEEINMNHNNNLEPPPAGPIPQNGPPGPIPQNHGPPRPNLQNPIPGL
ncbi:hypothetical protein Tco_0250616 [Tanacetum coccineum]